MDEKTKDKITDVIGSIAAAPVFAGSKIMEAAHKIGEKSPALDSMGENIGSAAVKARDTVAETAKRISESDTTKKIKDRFEQMSYVDNSAKIKGAFDKTQMAVKDIADKAKDGITDGAQKAKEGFAEFKESRQEKKAAVPEGFFEDAPADADVPEETASPEAGSAEPFAAEAGQETVSAQPEEGPGAEEAKAETLEEKVNKIGASVSEFVEKTAAVIEGKAEEIKEKAESFGADAAEKIDLKEAAAEEKAENFVEKAAFKIDEIADNVKASVEKLEDKIH